MRDGKQHLCDEELLHCAEGEPGVRAKRLRRHLEACALCRARSAQMESALAEFAMLEKSRLSAHLPAVESPRALLRSRLAELPRSGGSFTPRGHNGGAFFAWAFGFAGLATAMVVAGVLSFPPSPAAVVARRPLASERGILPDRAFTPGAARPASLAEVCALPHEEVVKQVSAQDRQRVFAEYGIPMAQSSRYEVDYLITPGLGGTDNIRNLWPEPYQAAMWNARTKDILEERLHEMVCSHQLDLSAAQEAIASNWIAAYRKYVQSAPSRPRQGKKPYHPTALSSILFSTVLSASLEIPRLRRFPRLYPAQKDEPRARDIIPEDWSPTIWS